MPLLQSEKINLDPEGLPEEKVKILEEETGDEERKNFKIKIANPFAKIRPVGEDPVLHFSHPMVEEFKEKGKKFNPNDLLTVQYIDHQGRKVQTRWTLSEYLKRIGFLGDRRKNISAFERFQKLAESGENLNLALKKAHQDGVQKRAKRGFGIDQKFADQAEQSREGRQSREKQLSSQYEEDPFFAKLLAGSGYVYTIELPAHLDYLDKIDSLVVVDVGDFDDEWEEGPVVIGVQRTLLEEGRNRLALKEEEIRQKPLWRLPEYPENSPVLRVLYREDPEEYYLSDGTSRLDALRQLTLEENRKNPKKAKGLGAKLLRADSALLGNSLKEIIKNYFEADAKNKNKVEEAMIKKTLDVLSQSLEAVKGYLKGTLPERDALEFDRQKRALEKIISIIEEDTGISIKK